MAKKSAISDESLARALGAYAGMVDKVLTDPERWLGVDEDDAVIAAAGLPRRALEALRDRTLGVVTPGSPNWESQPVEKRVDWWVDRIGLSAGLAAAAPRVVGALADRLPLQAALGASAAGLAVCAVAREHGIIAPKDWVPLLAQVLLNRELPAEAERIPSPETSEDQLSTPPVDEAEHEAGDAASPQEARPSRAAALGRGAQRAGQTLWRLARTFLELQNLLDERPRGGFFARTLAKLPLVGLAGGWLDERGAIRKAADETASLLA